PMRGPITNAAAMPTTTSSGPGTPRTVAGDTTRNGSAIASSARMTQPIVIARTLGERNRGPIPGTLIALSLPPPPPADHIAYAGIGSRTVRTVCSATRRYGATRHLHLGGYRVGRADPRAVLDALVRTRRRGHVRRRDLRAA